LGDKIVTTPPLTRAIVVVKGMRMLAAGSTSTSPRAGLRPLRSIVGGAGNPMRVGYAVGVEVGADVGAEVGDDVGAAVGTTVGVAVVGADVGATVGTAVGAAVGTAVGVAVVGTAVGAAVGTDVGAAVGTAVGVAVGVACNRRRQKSSLHGWLPTQTRTHSAPWV